MDREHYDLLKTGVSEWNAWRVQNPGVRSDLTYADLRRADLGEANLEGADLGEANLEGADLEEANLEGANLEGADLWGADLRGADLRRADLRVADLRGADLRDVQFDVAVTTQPLHIAGLRWHVMVYDDTMKIGCEGPYPLDEWEAFLDEDISEMDGDALEWWREWKEPVMALARAHKSRVKGGRS